MSAVLPPQGAFPFPAASSSPARPVAGFVAAPIALANPSIAGPQFQGAGGARRGAGLVTVVLIHVVVGWLLASGLARKAVEIVKKPIEMAIIPEEIKLPPPPPPPPKIEKIRDLPRTPPPPPAYVPPPDVPVAAPPEPVIQAVQAEPPKEPVVIAPPPPPVVEPPKPLAVKQEISLACPGYQAVLAQSLEDAFDRVGIAGTVRTLIKVRGSQVVDVAPQSGPKEYYKYVQTAVKRMRCSAGGAEEVQVSLDVSFTR